MKRSSGSRMILIPATMCKNVYKHVPRPSSGFVWNNSFRPHSNCVRFYCHCVEVQRGKAAHTGSQSCDSKAATLGLISKLVIPLLAQGGQQRAHQGGNMSKLTGWEIFMDKAYDLPGFTYFLLYFQSSWPHFTLLALRLREVRVAV